MDTSDSRHDAVSAERNRRYALWKELTTNNDPLQVTPRTLRSLGIFGGAQGIWVDKANTGGVLDSSEGIAVAVLHTGSHYSDDVTEEFALYHYPRTRRGPRRDQGEVDSLKAAQRLGMPIFFIMHRGDSPDLRKVLWSWVTDWDDVARIFLVSFNEHVDKAEMRFAQAEETFVPFTEKRMQSARVNSRQRQPKFQFDVMKRYGVECAACGMDVPSALDAAHVIPVDYGGVDDARNGLVLCATHHRLFDSGYFAIDPDSGAITPRKDRTLSDMAITFGDISRFSRWPHSEAMRWRWLNK